MSEQPNTYLSDNESEQRSQQRLQMIGTLPMVKFFLSFFTFAFFFFLGTHWPTALLPAIYR